MKNFNLNIEFQGGANYNEEKIQIDFFNKAISNIKDSKPSMIEIESNDCFYSILFNKNFDSNCINICAEVSENLLQLGMKNVKNNI
jgi:hypothetical protein